MGKSEICSLKSPGWGWFPLLFHSWFVHLEWAIQIAGSGFESPFADIIRLLCQSPTAELVGSSTKSISIRYEYTSVREIMSAVIAPPSNYFLSLPFHQFITCRKLLSYIDNSLSISKSVWSPIGSPTDVPKAEATTSLWQAPISSHFKALGLDHISSPDQVKPPTNLQLANRSAPQYTLER